MSKDFLMIVTQFSRLPGHYKGTLDKLKIGSPKSEYNIMFDILLLMT